MPKADILALKKKAKELRRVIIDMLYKSQSGHPGGSLSEIDMLVALYHYKLSVDANNPKDSKRDKFVLSKGHASPGLYSVLADKGYFPKKELDSFRKLGSMLQGHPELATPGVEYAGGSLGQGICFSVGLALAGKMDKSQSKVVVMIGDGESQEGAVWEASMAASFHKLGNLIAILDKNQVQETGKTRDVMNIDPAGDKWKAFGWNVIEINGHDMEQVVSALDKAWGMNNEKPTMIVSNTIKGKGVSFMELNHKFHGKAPNEEEYKKAIVEIEAIDANTFK